MTVRYARKRGSTIYAEAEVEIDASEVIEQFSDEDLIEEINERNLSAKVKKGVDPLEEFVGEALDAIRRRDYDRAELLLERALHPKFPTVELCEAEFKKARPA